MIKKTRPRVNSLPPTGLSAVLFLSKGSVHSLHPRCGCVCFDPHNGCGYPPSIRRHALQRNPVETFSMKAASLPYTVYVDGEIELPSDPALGRIYDDLTQRLTFSNPTWKKKMARGLAVHDTPRQRKAYHRLESGNLRIARGAWRLLRDIAQTHHIELQWEAHTIRAEDRPTELHCNATLRPYQEAAVQAALKHRAGVIVVPTGGGKTVIAMALAAALQTQTLFIVHTRELLRQTIESAERFLGIEAGVIGAGHFKPAPFTVALVQTLTRRELDEVADQFGLIIVDEAHHAPAWR